MSKRDDVLACQNAVNEAGISLAIAVQKAWPVGCIVCVSVGRGKIYMEVIGHGNHWSRPGELRGINPKTQKSRWFHYRMITEDSGHE